eukprot:CAMPEP_0168624220 /NCGR_PEP_ID=MMETSP0449_2-20121227/9282_1 /TAXON_ID=1082188 /ORGANISM="Strombidium rassoulzadegani, Strain ras09" /LENGTH=92 /DNA_ID=CAMNT_0008665733 /DNA_START=432 /DNA_END=710 /DNA_ORIENTATION=-
MVSPVDFNVGAFFALLEALGLHVIFVINASLDLRHLNLILDPWPYNDDKDVVDGAHEACEVANHDENIDEVESSFLLICIFNRTPTYSEGGD